MAQNNIPEANPQIIWLGTNMLAGLNSLGTTLGIAQISPAAFEFALQDFMACEASFDAFRSAKQVASTAWQSAAGAVDDWLKVVRGVLTGRFGNRWSPLWVQAGFIHHSTRVPDRVEDRLALAFSLASFFTGHASYEVASMQVTAARATTLRTAALAAFQALETVEQSMAAQGVACGSSRTALVGLMRGLIKILGATLGKDDARWEAFGLNMPGARLTPGQPVNVTAGLDFTGQISLQCEAVPLATRYRWRMRVAGSGVAYQLVGRSVVPAVLVAGVAPGLAVEFVVQAVNGDAQGVASVPVVFTMPELAGVGAAAPGAAGKVKGAAGRYGHAVSHGDGNGRFSDCVKSPR